LQRFNLDILLDGYDVTVKINNFYNTFINKNLVKNVTIARDT